MYKMTILSKIKSHSDTVDYFKELPFYNKPIEQFDDDRPDGGGLAAQIT